MRTRPTAHREGKKFTELGDAAKVCDATEVEEQRAWKSLEEGGVLEEVWGRGQDPLALPCPCAEARADASVLPSIITEEELVRKQVGQLLGDSSYHRGCWPATFPGGGVAGRAGR